MMDLEKELAPIVLFTYCRPGNTRETIEHLLQNEESAFSELIIYSDAPKNKKAEEGVYETRQYIHSIKGFKSISIIEHSHNRGLANSIVEGVTYVVNKYGRVIVLEDDLNVSPFFLRYMNEGLTRYENRLDIISIHGYNYPIKDKLPEAFLVKGADCWGWATWKRGWDLFNFDAKSLYNQIVKRKRQGEFDFHYSFSFMSLLKGQVDGKADSWAICWYASAFLNNKYTMYPGQSMVQLNDRDGVGATHGQNSIPSYFIVEMKEGPIQWELVEDRGECVSARKALIRYFNSRKPLKSRILTIIKRVLRIY